MKDSAERRIDSHQFSSLLKAFRDQFLDVSIGFVKHVPHTDSGITLAGSGTLIKASGVHAILTAGHVAAGLPEVGELALIVPTVTSRSHHKLVIEARLLEHVCFYNGDGSAQGPDLALLVLPAPLAGELNASKTFYNLDLRRAMMLNDPPQIDIGGWVLNGILDEETKHLTPEPGDKCLVEFHGLTRYGKVIKPRCAENFDYLSFQPIFDDGREPPRSFGGCSGAGLWHALIGEPEGVPAITDLLLSGVAYYQSPTEDGNMIIECHGRQSIYASAIQELERIAARSA